MVVVESLEDFVVCERPRVSRRNVRPQQPRRHLPVVRGAHELPDVMQQAAHNRFLVRPVSVRPAASVRCEKARDWNAPLQEVGEA
eukprot:2625614-Rhodomonas_salina.2